MCMLYSGERFPMNRVLFVTWDGPQVSYLEGLFLPIFRSLKDYGWSFHVLQFTWGRGAERNMAACKSAGIPYRSVEVLRKPLSFGAFVTAIKGGGVQKAITDWDIDVLMPRSPFAFFACLRVLRNMPLPMIYDADGLPIDERVDFGDLSPTSLTCRILRDVESLGVHKAKVVLTRTDKASEILHARAGAGTMESKFVRVINGRDSGQFSLRGLTEREGVRRKLGIGPEAPLVVYAGSLGGQYCLPEMLALFRNILSLRSDARLLLLTGSPEIADAEIDQYPELLGKIFVRTAEHHEVPSYIASADLGLGLRKTSFSMQGVAPIKLGEYLLCGVPVIATKGIGDVGGIPEDIAFILGDHCEGALMRAATWFVNKVLVDREGYRVRSRELGMTRFSLQASVDSYRRALVAGSKLVTKQAGEGM